MSVATAVAYLIATPPTYESQASIRIGSVPGPGANQIRPVEEPNAISTQLQSEYGEIAGADQRAYLKSSSVQNGVLHLVGAGSSPSQTREFLANIVTGLIQRHGELYEEAVGALRAELEVVESQLGTLKRHIADLNDIVGRLKDTQPMQASLAVIERARLYPMLTDLQLERAMLQRRSREPYVTRSGIILPPTSPTDAVAPAKIGIITLGLIAGLAFGLLAVFAVEFFENLRPEKLNP